MHLIEATVRDNEIVRELFREYQQWSGVDMCFQNFEQELAELPGAYAAPKGCIILARENQLTLGCIALRPRTEKEAELKRLYVRPEFHGRGIGKSLFQALMKKAPLLGYDSIVLETLPIMAVARSMYRTYGFEQAPAHTPDSDQNSAIEFYRYQFSASD